MINMLDQLSPNNAAASGITTMLKYPYHCGWDVDGGWHANGEEAHKQAMSTDKRSTLAVQQCHTHAVAHRKNNQCHVQDVGEGPHSVTRPEEVPAVRSNPANFIDKEDRQQHEAGPLGENPGTAHE